MKIRVERSTGGNLLIMYVYGSPLNERYMGAPMPVNQMQLAIHQHAAKFFAHGDTELLVALLGREAIFITSDSLLTIPTPMFTAYNAVELHQQLEPYLKLFAGG